MAGIHRKDASLEQAWEEVSLEQAQQLIGEQLRPITETEWVPLPEAPGRVLAEDQIAAFDQPPFHRSPIDGYACRSADISGASKETPVYLQVIAEVCAGQWCRKSVGTGQAVRIMTGAPVPEGCDCCVYQEDTDYGEEQVAVYRSVGAWENFCFRGEDFKQGTRLLERGTKVGSVEAGILAGMGKAEIPVLSLPKAALLTTGDEVAAPGKPLLPGKIYDSNQTLLAVRLRELGIRPAVTETVRDDADEMAEAIRQAAKTCDIVITTGGVSVGKKDLVHQALGKLNARRIFWRVKVKPGMPTLFSMYGNIPVISLSGNPFGAAAIFEVLVRPALAALTTDPTLLPVRGSGIMADEFPKASVGRRLVRAIWKDGTIRLPKGLHSSGVLSSMKGCNCLVDIPPGTEALHAGDSVEVIFISSPYGIP